MDPEAGKPQLDALSALARVPGLGQPVRRNAGPFGEVPVLDRERVGVSGVHNARERECGGVRLAGPRLS